MKYSSTHFSSILSKTDVRCIQIHYFLKFSILQTFIKSWIKRNFAILSYLAILKLKLYSSIVWSKLIEYQFQCFGWAFNETYFQVFELRAISAASGCVLDANWLRQMYNNILIISRMSQHLLAINSHSGVNLPPHYLLAGLLTRELIKFILGQMRVTFMVWRSQNTLVFSFQLEPNEW